MVQKPLENTWPLTYRERLGASPGFQSRSSSALSKHSEVSKRSSLTLPIPLTPRRAQLRPKGDPPCEQAAMQDAARETPLAPSIVLSPELREGAGSGWAGTDRDSRRAFPGHGSYSLHRGLHREAAQETLGTPRPRIPTPPASRPCGRLPAHAAGGGGDSEL